MRLFALVGATAAVGAMSFFLISGFLGEGAALAVTGPAVLFTVLALGLGLR